MSSSHANLKPPPRHPYTVDSVITHTSFLRVISTVSNRSALGILGRISLGWWPLNECLKKELSTVHLWQSTKKGEKRVWVMTESTVILSRSVVSVVSVCFGVFISISLRKLPKNAASPKYAHKPVEQGVESSQ